MCFKGDTKYLERRELLKIVDGCSTQEFVDRVMERAAGEGSSKLRVSFSFARCGAAGAVNGPLIEATPAAGVTSTPLRNTCNTPVTPATGAPALSVIPIVDRTAVERAATKRIEFVGVCVAWVTSMLLTVKSTAKAGTATIADTEAASTNTATRAAEAKRWD
jgi:hypothetical protein